MAGGYITETGFVDDETQTTASQELSLDSVCGGATLLSTGTTEIVVEPKAEPKQKVGE